ncbi:MAG: DNA translocase FtsK 4TM domain-containing protein [Alphaproteobacteria bacterium]|nr:DNA translocase FtsK 4TM domain-containing protein [Alphaproteobacteria bacterium]
MRSASARKTTFLPAGIREFLRRRSIEAAGLLLALLAIAVALALASHSASDPSLNSAGNGPVANWLGGAGAMTADFLLQTIGVAAWLLVPLLLAWSWRILAKRGIARFWMRLALLPLALLTATLAAAGFADPETSPGGFTGVLLFREIAALELPLTAGMVGAIAGLGTLLAFLPALGFDRREWQAAARGIVFLGQGLLRAGQAALAFARRTAQGGFSLLRAEMDRRRDSRIVDAAPAAAPEAPAAQASAAAAPSAPDKEASRVVPRPKGPAIGKRAKAEREPKFHLLAGEAFALPPLDLLNAPPKVTTAKIDESALEQNARLLESVLADFGVRGEITKVRPGPIVTLYELEPAPGTKTSRVISLSDDIARSMSAVSVRVAVVAGRNVIGIELPNAGRETVYLRELLASSTFEKTAQNLTLVLGKDIGGSPMMVDLARMPHLLIAGTTGSGKSVAINTMILSLLYRLPPEKCKLILIDPKMLELSTYDEIPHLLHPVVTEPKKAIVALKWAVREMENRYRAMSKLGVRNIDNYNARVEEAKKKGEILTRTIQTGFDPETGKPVFEEQPFDLTPLPYIVVVVDEMADLMLIAGKDVELAIQRLSQMARAAGVHLIMATQRPSVDVVTGTIKANFPTRISFQVTSKIDSRTILGDQGAEQLLGQGDMLYMTGGGRITRIHGPFVSDEEVERVVNFLKEQSEPVYVDQITEEEEDPFAALPEGEGDDLYNQAVALVRRERKASTSFIQRHLQIGYNRAARIMDQMEADGLVSPANHVGKREVLIGEPDKVS